MGFSIRKTSFCPCLQRDYTQLASLSSSLPFSPPPLSLLPFFLPPLPSPPPHSLFISPSFSLFLFPSPWFVNKRVCLFLLWGCVDIWAGMGRSLLASSSHPRRRILPLPRRACMTVPTCACIPPAPSSLSEPALATLEALTTGNVFQLSYHLFLVPLPS